MQGIYRIQNKLNGKYYIGSSKDVRRRYADHRRRLEKGNHIPCWQQDWDKYGEENFVFEVVEEVEGNREALLAIEQVYLNDGVSKGLLYNAMPVAGGGGPSEEGRKRISESLTGRERSKEHCTNISRALTGRKLSDEHKDNLSRALRGENNPNYGKSFSETHRANLSKAMMGKKHSEETKAKIGKTISGENHPMYNKHRTEETKTRISNTLTGRKLSEEHKANISRGCKGKKFTGEHKANIGKATAKPYPAFYNEKTGECILAGVNFRKMCEECNLNYNTMFGLKNGYTKETKDGWKVVTLEEMIEHGDTGTD